MKMATLAFCIAGFSWVASAHGGHGFFKHRAVPVTSYASAPAATSTCATCGGSVAGDPGMAGFNGASVAGQPTAPPRPYSYYVAAPGMARGYYGYGQDEFPFYGRAYGHPYDPWTWPYMTYEYQNSLNRYYEPPVK